jgi:ABC-type oligopeptide transport system substrate-binding subunit
MTRRLLRLWPALLVVPAALALPAAQGSIDAQAGGIFRVSFQGSSSLQAFDHVDPALAYSRESWTILDTVCARLMRYRDAPPPRGYQLVPEVAAAPPTVSADRTTWSFRLRSGFRFSDGRPVTAGAFAQAIYRTMAPRVDSPAWAYTKAIVGADDVRAGLTPRAAGVEWRGNTLVVRFTRPVGAFDAWTTMPFFCAVPPTLPPDREGVRDFPGAGPYYVKEYRPNGRVVIRRNRYYGGSRAHHVDGFDVDLSSDSPEQMLERIETGKADWGYTFAQQYANRGLFFRSDGKWRFDVRPGLTMAMFAINSARPLFKDNPRLRQAVNLALERLTFTGNPAVTALTDQHLPPTVTGFQDRTIYPLTGDLTRARALAAGNLRSGEATLYMPACAGTLACGQVVARQLERIGLDVDVRPFPEYATASAYLGTLGNPNESWDLALVHWSPDFVDPFAYINRLLDAEDAGGTNLTGFDEPEYLELMRRAARLEGTERAQAYAELDLRLARDAAPLMPLYVVKEATLVSARVNPKCMLLRPGLVLTTVCLKRPPA